MMRLKLLLPPFFFLGLLLAGCEREEDVILNHLFELPETAFQNLASKTFVYLLHGDADHWVGETSLTASQKLYKSDQIEAERIRADSARCADCNVVFLHVQRGGDRWYTMEEQWATFLRVYVRGELVLTRSVPIVNVADTRVLSRLMQFSNENFASTEFHLVYRGHSFFPAYDPALLEKGGVERFAYQFPEFPYGIPQFGESLKSTRLPFESVTIAACHMATVEMVRAVSPYTKYMISTEVDVLETASVSFDTLFMTDRNLMQLNGREFVDAMAKALMNRFETTGVWSEVMMEYPVSVIDLEKFKTWDDEMKRSMQDLRPLQKNLPLQKYLSNRYVEHLMNEGKTENEILNMIRFVQMPLEGMQLFDAGQWLDAIENSFDAVTLRGKLNDVVHVFHGSTHSTKMGLSFKSEDY
jgi:hypothetical protein